MPDLRTVDGEPPGAAVPVSVPVSVSVEAGDPEIVLGHEAQQVATEVGQAQIAHLPMLFPKRGPSNSGSRFEPDRMVKYLVPGSVCSPLVSRNTYETVSFLSFSGYVH